MADIDPKLPGYGKPSTVKPLPGSNAAGTPATAKFKPSAPMQPPPTPVSAPKQPWQVAGEKETQLGNEYIGGLEAAAQQKHTTAAGFDKQRQSVQSEQSAGIDDLRQKAARVLAQDLQRGGAGYLGGARQSAMDEGIKANTARAMWGKELAGVDAAQNAALEEARQADIDVTAEKQKLVQQTKLLPELLQKKLEQAKAIADEESGWFTTGADNRKAAARIRELFVNETNPYIRENLEKFAKSVEQGNYDASGLDVAWMQPQWLTPADKG